jgi:ribosome-binding factor A
MTTRRLLKAAEAIRQVVGMAILAEMRDPRVRNVTITRVVVSPDMREAKVYVSVMGDTAQQNLCLHGLQSARGFLQSKLAERIETRYTPRLQFILDMGVKRSLEIARILQEVLPPKPPADADHPDSDSAAKPTAEQAFPEDDDIGDDDVGDDGDAALDDFDDDDFDKLDLDDLEDDDLKGGAEQRQPKASDIGKSEDDRDDET